jgi:hypothetical protein
MLHDYNIKNINIKNTGQAITTIDRQKTNANNTAIENNAYLQNIPNVIITP